MLPKKNLHLQAVAAEAAVDVEAEAAVAATVVAVAAAVVDPVETTNLTMRREGS